jgi:hypothetical protein
MGGFETIDEGILSGALIENEDIASDADINPIKTEKRSQFINCNFMQSPGPTTGLDTAFQKIVFPNASADTAYMNFLMPKAEISPGEKGILHIWWHANATSGSVRFVIDLKPAIEGVANLSSAIQRTTLATARSVADQLVDTRVDIPPAILNNNQLLAIKLYRDPANTLDTLAADVSVDCVYLEVLGRC